MALVLCGFCLAFVPCCFGKDAFISGTEWDGHLKLYTRALFPGSDSPHQAVGLSSNFDGYAELRLNNKTFFGDALFLEVNYETLAGGGGTRRDGERLKGMYPGLFPHGLSSPVRADRRFFDLTATLTAILNWGDANTEYGGYAIPDTGFYATPANTISAWGTWYF